MAVRIRHSEASNYLHTETSDLYRIISHRTISYHIVSIMAVKKHHGEAADEVLYVSLVKQLTFLNQNVLN